MVSMRTWAEELLVGLQDLRDIAQMLDCIGQSARKLGFEQCAYGYRRAVPFTNPKTVMVNDYNPVWRRRYVEAGYLHIDPTVLHGSRDHTPLVWTDQLFLSAPQLWDEARSFGLSVGWAQSCFDGKGAVGLLSLSRSHDALTRSELALKEPQLRSLVNIAHTALSVAIERSEHGTRPALTPRETEVLQWTADGKTSAEVGAILDISLNTVNFHVKNAIVKLRVANKSAAVAAAVGLGLLH